MNDLFLFLIYLLQYGGIAIIVMAVWMLYELVVVLRRSSGETHRITLVVRATLIVTLASAGFLALGVWLTLSAQNLAHVITHLLW
jgi:hypothetical protein